MLKRVLALTLLLALWLTFASAKVSSISGRLSENDIVWPNKLLRDIPIVDPPQRVAGYFKLNRTHDAHMFYFYFQARNNPTTAPVVLWMTGGPGCSSELAVFYENGPYKLNPDNTISETEFGWDVDHNVIFVDQPINTGFSYSKDPRDEVSDEETVAEDMLDFLSEFFEVHSDIVNNDFFVTGESYAGHYVPAVSYRLYRAVELEGFDLNFQGFAIGNGLTNAAIQFGAYADFAYANGILSESLRDSINFWYPLCRFGANLCDSTQWFLPCDIALDICQLTTFERVLNANPGINVYDITKKCDGPLCYDMTQLTDFMNRADVQAALGVDRKWQECSFDVYADFTSDWLRNFDSVIPEMMEDGIRVMIYAGDLDLICNWMGNERWVNKLQWYGSDQWSAVTAKNWSADASPGSNSEASGTVRSLGPLSFVRVFKAGHMVPMDQPRNALKLITSFTRNQSLTLDDLEQEGDQFQETTVMEDEDESGKYMGKDRGQYMHVIRSQAKKTGVAERGARSWGRKDFLRHRDASAAVVGAAM